MKPEDVPNDLNDYAFVQLEFEPYTNTRDICSLRDVLENESWNVWYDLTRHNTILMNIEHLCGSKQLDIDAIKGFADNIKMIEAD